MQERLESRVVFQATRNGKTEIWATRERTGPLGSLRKAGGEPVQLTGGQLSSTMPVLSPDGKKLYVVGQKLRGELTRYNSKSKLWVSYLSGISAEFADFSRDGRRSDHHALMLFDWKTQTWAELANGELNWQNWSRDGRHVYFEQHGTQHAVMRVGLDDHKIDEVVSLQNLKRTGVNGSFWFGLTPDDSPIVLRDTGTQEIYALDWRAQ